jgi:PAS domain S-box-containing protein
VRVFGIAKRRDGKTIRVYGALQDVTKHKRAEQALAESQGELTAIFDAAADGILLAETEGRKFRSANASICRMLGYSHDEMLDLGVSDLYRKEDLAHVFEEFDRHVKGESALSVNLRLKRKDGSVFFADVSSAPVTLGGKSFLVGIFRDITERKVTEEALREREHLLSESQRLGHIGSWFWDLTGPFQWSEETYRLYGVSPDTFIPTPETVLDLIRDDARPAMKSWFNNFVLGEQHELEFRLNEPDGAGRVLLGRGEAVAGNGDHRAYMAGTVQDVTERKRAENEKAALEAQLRQAQKMESVGRLAGGVAHDFNNILGVILGHAELALAQVDPAQSLHTDLEEIYKAAMRSADLTRQLLAFARKQTVAPKVLDLNDVVASMLNMMRRLIGENIDLQWKPGADLWSVKVDPSQLDQILANLCVNARDAVSGIGKMIIETDNSVLDEPYCAAHAGCAPGDYVRLAVSDDGCGMDKDTQSHLFEPFFTTKAAGEGTGLGLATVYGAVKQNSGYINVYSEPGHGTTFTIYLPRQLDRAAQMQAPGATRPVPIGHETILLVEDERSILTLAKRLLENHGYTVLAASTPGEAISLAKGHTGEIHLLMTDVVMPEMNGRVLAKHLLALRPQIKRLFMSGYTANVIAHHGVLDEGVHFIQKPFTMDSLAAKVRDALDAPE